MNIAIPLFVALVSSSTFVDVHERFEIDLPQGWDFAPQPGDASGASFRVERDGLIAQMTIRVLELKEFLTLKEFVEHLKRYERQPKSFKLVREKKSSLGQLKSHMRRYTLRVEGHDSWEKLVEERYAVWGPYSYILRVEAIAEGFSSFLNDIEAIADGFKPILAGKSIDSDTPAPSFAGAWYMNVLEESKIQFSKDYSFTMDQLKGRYWVKDESIIVFMKGGKEKFGWKIIDGVLLLSGKRLGEGIRYLREKEWLEQKAWVQRLIGKWSNKKHTIVFKGFDEMLFNGKIGTFRVSGKRLSLILGEFKEDFSLTLRKGKLRLKPLDPSSGVQEMSLVKD